MNAQPIFPPTEPQEASSAALADNNMAHRITENGDSGSLPATAPPRRFSVKQLVLAGLILIAVIATGKIGHDWWTVGRFLVATDDAYVGGDVTVIAPQVAGYISAVAVTDNQPVHAGDLLIKLDDHDYRAALAKADAGVAMQEAALTNLEATRYLQEAIVAQARAETAATAAEIVRAHDDQLRYQKLLAIGAVSIQSSQRADTDYQQALAAEQKFQAALAAAQRQLQVIDTQKQLARATLAQAGAERELARLNLGYTELRAPIDGLVGNRSAQLGAYAPTGSQLISLIPTRGLWVDANLKENQLAQVHPGLPVAIRVDSIPGQTFPGHVVSIAPATGAEFSVLPPENATGNFTKIVQRVTIRVAFNDEAAARGHLRPGLSVTVEVNTRGKAAR